MRWYIYRFHNSTTYNSGHFAQLFEGYVVRNDKDPHLVRERNNFIFFNHHFVWCIFQTILIFLISH